MRDYVETAILLAVVSVGLGLKVRQLTIAKKAQKWPSVEGTIESGKMEQVAGGGRTPPIVLPVFSFSYQVAGQYYGGRFALLPYITDPSVVDPSFLEHMIGRQIHLNYNPERPEVWFVTDELIEGCRVEQKYGRELVNFPQADEPGARRRGVTLFGPYLYSTLSWHRLFPGGIRVMCLINTASSRSPRVLTSGTRDLAWATTGQKMSIRHRPTETLLLQTIAERSAQDSSLG